MDPDIDMDVDMDLDSGSALDSHIDKDINLDTGSPVLMELLLRRSLWPLLAELAPLLLPFSQVLDTVKNTTLTFKLVYTAYSQN